MKRKNIHTRSKDIRVGEKKKVEVRGIDPRTSRMLSERSTIWATPPGWELIVLHEI